MRFSLISSKWRKILIILGAICTLIAIGFVGWLLWVIHASEDKVGEISFKDDKSLILQKKGSGGVSYKIDNAPATFRLDVVKRDGNCERIFPSYAAALKFATDAGAIPLPLHGGDKDPAFCVTILGGFVARSRPPSPLHRALLPRFC